MDSGIKSKKQTPRTLPPAKAKSKWFLSTYLSANKPPKYVDKAVNMMKNIGIN
jgi:hypothetical protein